MSSVTLAITITRAIIVSLIISRTLFRVKQPEAFDIIRPPIAFRRHTVGVGIMIIARSAQRKDGRVLFTRTLYDVKGTFMKYTIPISPNAVLGLGLP